MEYDIDWDGPIPLDDDNTVVIPNCNHQLDEDQLEELSNTVDPLDQSQNYGIDVYLSALQFVTD